MATIGTFKKTNANEFTGEIVTLSVQAKGVRIVPDTRANGENAPSHRVVVGHVRALNWDSNADPLLFFKGKFGALEDTRKAPASMPQIETELMW